MAAWGHRLHRIMTGQPIRWDTGVKAALKLHPPWRLPTGGLLAPGAIPEGVICVLCVCVCVCWCVCTHTHTHIQGMRQTVSDHQYNMYTHTHTQGMRQTVSEPSTQSTRAPTRAETLAGKPLLSGMEYFCTILLLLLCMEGSQESGQSSHESADRY
jgi:hypothetical protein